MTFTNEERTMYRELAGAAEYWYDEGTEYGILLATDALREALEAVGYDTSAVNRRELRALLDDCARQEVGIMGDVTPPGCHLPKDPWWFKPMYRKLNGGWKSLPRRVANQGAETGR